MDTRNCESRLAEWASLMDEAVDESALDERDDGSRAGDADTDAGAPGRAGDPRRV
jgi:hypothetical protein